MEHCIYCKNQLIEAKYLLINDMIYKSCPSCSREEDEHVFYSCPEKFGVTQKRITGNNPMGLQSHCGKCRANKVGVHTGSIICSDVNIQNGVIISEIRFLPMSTDIFKTYEDASEFILNEMPMRGGTYYFMRSKMDCEDNSFVLFQHKGQLIGYAIYEETVVLEKPYHDGVMDYNGYYKFVNGSINLLVTPISLEQIKKIDPTIKSFNQSPQRKTIGLLPAIFKYIHQSGGITKANDYIVSLPEEINENDEKSLKEGQKKQIVVNAYERNPEARARCISYYKKINKGKVICEVCGFDFGQTYGKEFEGKIHIHHLKEISLVGEEYEIDAEKDLIPICPNCHMIAHSRKPAIAPEVIKSMICIQKLD